MQHLPSQWSVVGDAKDEIPRAAPATVAVRIRGRLRCVRRGTAIRALNCGARATLRLEAASVPLANERRNAVGLAVRRNMSSGMYT